MVCVSVWRASASGRQGWGIQAGDGSGRPHSGLALQGQRLGQEAVSLAAAAKSKRTVTRDSVGEESVAQGGGQSNVWELHVARRHVSMHPAPRIRLALKQGTDASTVTINRAPTELLSHEVAAGRGRAY